VRELVGDQPERLGAVFGSLLSSRKDLVVVKDLPPAAVGAVPGRLGTERAILCAAPHRQRRNRAKTHRLATPFDTNAVGPIEQIVDVHAACACEDLRLGPLDLAAGQHSVRNLGNLLVHRHENGWGSRRPFSHTPPKGEDPAVAISDRRHPELATVGD